MPGPPSLGIAKRLPQTLDPGLRRSMVAVMLLVTLLALIAFASAFTNDLLPSNSTLYVSASSLLGDMQGHPPGGVFGTRRESAGRMPTQP